MTEGSRQKKTYQHEDSVLKTSMQCFADELMPYLGIEGKVEAIGQTEEVHLDITKLFQDYNFVMKDGSWKHFEFQSKNEGIPGLRRFRMYEAVTSHHHNVPVTTYVLYSGNIKRPVTRFREGLNSYRVFPIIMKKRNADTLFKELGQKIRRGEMLTKRELVPLILSPLMSGKSSLKERFLESFRITKNAEKVDPQDVRQIEAAMYAMAEKFLEKADLQELGREIKMTRLGQMIFDDGLQEGIQQGIQQGIQRGIQEGIQQGLSVGIKNVTESYRKFGAKKKETIEKIVNGFGKTPEEAEAEVEKYW